MSASAIRLSKCMSQYLRHRGTVDAEGWCTIAHLATQLAATEQAIRDVAAPGPHNLKDRFEIDADRIRARQGHSIGVHVGTPITTWNNKCATRNPHSKRWEVVHGTSLQRLGGGPEPLLRTGLSRMSRDDIHMSPNSQVERWHTWYNVEVWVDVEAAQAAGIEFRLSGNGVVLSAGNEEGVIPPRFLRIVVRQTKK